MNNVYYKLPIMHKKKKKTEKLQTNYNIFSIIYVFSEINYCCLVVVIRNIKAIILYTFNYF